MKRTMIFFVIALSAAGLAVAQSNQAQPGPGGNDGSMMGRYFGAEAPEAKSVEGKLVFIDDYPAIQAKDKTYMIRMPRFYYYAYTDNIREGAQFRIDGYVLPTLPGQDKPFLVVTKATVNGKTYDFTGFGYRHMGRFRGSEGRGPMMGGYGPMMGGEGPMGGDW